MEEKKELNAGQKIVKAGCAGVAGMGAGVLVGMAGLALADALPCGGFIKGIARVGAIGLEILATIKVQDAVNEYFDNVFDVVNNIKAIFDGTEQNDGPVKAEGAVE